MGWGETGRGGVGRIWLRGLGHRACVFTFGCLSQIDVDTDQSLSYSEFETLMHKYLPSLPQQQVGEVCQLLDGNGDGSIDFDEFAKVRGSSPRPRLLDATPPHPRMTFGQGHHSRSRNHHLVPANVTPSPSCPAPDCCILPHAAPHRPAPPRLWAAAVTT